MSSLSLRRGVPTEEFDGFTVEGDRPPLDRLLHLGGTLFLPRSKILASSGCADTGNNVIRYTDSEMTLGSGGSREGPTRLPRYQRTVLVAPALSRDVA